MRTQPVHEVQRTARAAVKSERLAHDAQRLCTPRLDVRAVVDRLPDAPQVAAGELCPDSVRTMSSYSTAAI